MTADHDQFWLEIAGQSRRQRGIQPPSLAEADKELEAAGEVPVSELEIERMVTSVTAGQQHEDEEPLLTDFTEDEEAKESDGNGERDA